MTLKNKPKDKKRRNMPRKNIKIRTGQWKIKKDKPSVEAKDEKEDQHSARSGPYQQYYKNFRVNVTKTPLSEKSRKEDVR